MELQIQLQQYEKDPDKYEYHHEIANEIGKVFRVVGFDVRM